MERLVFSDTSSEVASIRGDEVVEEAAAGVIEDKFYVAVGKDVKASKSTLLWAMQNTGGKKICIIHCHQPTRTISVLGGKFPISSLGKPEVKAHREAEKKEMAKTLDGHLRFCTGAGVLAEILHIETESIEKGIVELISRERIVNLVMGAAIDGRYSRKMVEPKSKKANYVRKQAPTFCHIWFVCKGHLICSREGSIEYSPDAETGRSNSETTTISDNDQPGHCLERNGQTRIPGPSPYESGALSIQQHPCSDTRKCFQELVTSPTFTFSQTSSFSRRTDSSSSYLSPQDSETYDLRLSLVYRAEERHCNSSAPSVSSSEFSINDKIYNQLERAMSEAENSRQLAFEESMKCMKAERYALEAIRMAKDVQRLYFEEVRKRKEMEEELTKMKEDLNNANEQRNLVVEELRVVKREKSLLEGRVGNTDLVVNELEKKIFTAMNLLQNYDD